MTAFRIGDVLVSRVEEMMGPGFEPAYLFPDFDESRFGRHLDWMVPKYYDPAAGRFIASVHTWVLQTRYHTILVDSCTGNHKRRPAFERFNMLDLPFLDRLASAGVAPADVDFVLCTHLHIDHVGWNTRLENGRWVPTFPNARYVVSRTEHDHWDPRISPLASLPENEGVYDDSVLPVVENGLALLIDGDHAIEDGLVVRSAPGHTPGHVMLALESAGARAIFCGDVMHQPVQVYEPDWNSRFCEQPEVARATRRAILEDCSERGALLLPAHFGPPHAGHIRSTADGFAIDFS